MEIVGIFSRAAGLMALMWIVLKITSNRIDVVRADRHKDDDGLAVSAGRRYGPFVNIIKTNRMKDE